MLTSRILYNGARTYWLLCLGMAIVFAALALLFSLLVSPTYQANARLLVSVADAAPQGASSPYQETAVAQQLALSLVPFASSSLVTEPVVRSLQLPMTASEVSKNVVAAVEPETVLINLTVSDSSDVRSREIANAVAFEYSDFVSRLPPQSGLKVQITPIEPAVTPDTPIAPNITRNVALAALAGVGIGALGAAALASFKRTVTSTSAVKQAVGRIPLGAMPYSSSDANPTESLVPVSPAVIEASREIRTNLTHALRHAGSKTLTVTSPNTSEGKTWVTSQIAGALSDAGYQVALLDADLRSAGLSQRYGLHDEKGLADVVRGSVGLESVLHTIASGISAVPAGIHRGNPSELLDSGAMGHVVRTLRTDFDYVLVDTPPILAFTDSAILAGITESTAIVVKHSATDLKDLESAIFHLDLVDATVAGVVVNFSPVAKVRRKVLDAAARSGRG